MNAVKRGRLPGVCGLVLGRARGWSVGVAAVLLCGCKPVDDSLPEGPRKFVDLVNTLAWQPVPAARDPLAHERPEEVKCPLGTGYRHEDSGFDIQTGPCNYGMFSQRTLAPVRRGAKLKLLVYHFDLVAREPAQAHAAVLLGERVLWEQTIAIPGKANAYNVEFVAEFFAPADTPIYFHVHNHGQNSWTFASAKVQVPGDMNVRVGEGPGPR